MNTESPPDTDLDTIFGRITDAFYALDEQWRFTYLNDRAEELIDVDNIGLEGTIVWEEFGWVADSMLREQYERAMETQEPVSFEFYYPDPLDAWFDITAYPSETGLSVYFQDISERKERQRQLEQIETVFEHAQDALFLVDVGEEFTAERVNPAWEELTGLTAEQASGQTPQDIFDQQAGELIEDKYHKCVQRREPLRYEETIRLNGEHGHFVAQLAPIIVDGNVEYIAGSTRDVTERREYEQKLKAQNERLDEFASVVSHDLRTPLTVASGHAELAAQECDTDHLADVMQALTRAEELLDDLLTLAQQGETLGDRQQIELQELLSRCWNTIKTSNATLTIDADSTFEGDPSRLAQAFENLFRNAIEHGGESVTITVGVIDGEGIYVADDGPGIPGDDREDVFDSGFTTHEEGTGFGLAIVEEICQAHGWAITVTESEAQGARFEIIGIDSLTC